MTSREIAENCLFWKDVREHRLLSDEQLDRCLANVPEDKREPEKIDNRLARVAIHQGFLTLWQAQRILTRRAGTLRIDKYLLTDALGQGGMGRVFLARDTRLQRQVALKVLNPDKLNHERALARFQREALVGGQLQHENLVRVYDVGVHQNSPFLVMEYIEGPTVAELIARQGRLEIPVAARIGRDVSLGLHHLAEKRLVHRDVNPRNILIDKEGRAKLTDLGLAIFEEQLSQVTTEGSTVGTFDYISPEQARHSRGVDIRSDIYSLGCSLYHMIAGHPPFPEGNLAEKIYSHQLREAEPLADLVPGVPQELSALVYKCLRKSPDERYATARELGEKLSRFVTDESLATTIELNRSATAETASVTPPSLADQNGRSDGSDSVRANSQDPEHEDSAEDARNRRPDESLQLDLGLGSLELPFRPDSSRSRSMDSASGESGGSRKRRNALVLGGVAIGILVLVRSLILPGIGSGASDRLAVTKTGESEKVPKVPQKSKSAESVVPSTTISVKYQDGQIRSFDSLDDAIRTASGQTAEIEIPQRDSPWTWTVLDARPIAGSHWKIQGTGREKPRVVFDLSNSKSGLLIRADSVLDLSGLRIEPKDASSSRPMISANGQFQARDCWWRRSSGVVPPKSAIQASARQVTLNSCWFSGFPQVLDAKVLPDSKIDLNHSIFTFVPATEGTGKTDGKPQSKFALRLEFPNWSVDRASVRIDGCLFVHATVIALAGTNRSPSISMTANRTVFVGERLFSFEAGFAATGMRPKWTGTHDTFRKGMSFWPSDGKEPGSSDLENWRKMVSETDATMREVTLPKEITDTWTPGDLIPGFDLGGLEGLFSEFRDR
ncbi:protein kinase [bacterium]|nr:protein kinase [bacterium]